MSEHDKEISVETEKKKEDLQTLDEDLTVDKNRRKIQSSPKNNPKDNKLGFEDLGVPTSFVEQLKKLSWNSPTAIQKKSLPSAIKGQDIAGFAQTGTGKTGVFLITLAQKLLQTKGKSQQKTSSPYALVICPTRELAIQISEDAQSILSSLGINVLTLYGGVDIDPQIKLAKKTPELIVATPGRLLDLYRKQAVDLANVKMFVCDEVDRMFDMGFIDDVEFILEKLGERVQKLFFSATSNEKVKELIYEYLDNPKYISVNMEEPTPDAMSQHAIICEAENKFKIILSLLKKHDPGCAIIFTNTKIVASWLQYKIEKNSMSADAITGDLPQKKRIQLIRRIKKGDLKVLIATDVASRGLHIANVTHVYNFDVPDDAANYVHRIGRTARAGSTGESYTLICEEYGHNFEAVQKILGDKSPTPVWYEKELLDIEDKSPNPFLEDFNKPSEKTFSTSRERSRERSSRDQRDSNYNKRRSSSQFKKPYDKYDQRSRSKKATPLAKRKSKPRYTPSEHQAGFGAIVKRAFGLLFGRRKNNKKR